MTVFEFIVGHVWNLPGGELWLARLLVVSVDFESQEFVEAFAGVETFGYRTFFVFDDVAIKLAGFGTVLGNVFLQALIHFAVGAGYVTFDRTPAEMVFAGNRGFDIRGVTSHGEHSLDQPEGLCFLFFGKTHSGFGSGVGHERGTFL